MLVRATAMDRRWGRVLTGLAVALLLVSACSALRLRETYIAGGDLIEITEDTPTDKDASVRLFLESAPEGFELVGGEPVVQAGYGHRVLGRIELALGRGTCDPGDGNYLSREAVFKRLRGRAQRAGGDALVYVRTRARDVWMSDCDRIEQARKRGAHGPWAEGWVVVLEPPEPDAGMPTDAVPDGGLSDAQAPLGAGPLDGGMPAEAAVPLPSASSPVPPTP